MYCKYCGKQNSDNDFYCVHCGSALNLQENLYKLSGVKETKLAYCKKCGEHSENRFCTNCGEVTYKLVVQQGTDLNFGVNNLKSLKNMAETTIMDQYKNIKSGDTSSIKKIINDKELVKNSAIAAVKIFIIGIMLSLALFMCIKQIESVSYVFDQMNEAINQPEIQKATILPNALDVFGIALQIPSTFSGSGNIMGQDLGKATISVSVHILILLIFPLIAVWISLYKVFKDDKPTTQYIPLYAITALIFSAATNIILLLNSKSLAGTGDGFNIKASGRFNTISGCITAFLIIFFIQLFLSLIYKKERISNISVVALYNENMSAFRIYVKNMLLYTLFFMVIIVLSILFTSMETKTKLIAIMGFIGVLPNILVNVWLFICGNKFSFISPEGTPIQFSLAGAWENIAEIAKYGGGDFSDFAPFYVLIILIAVAVIYIIIEASGKLSEKNYFIKLSIFAGSISLINLFISLLCDFRIKAAGSTDLLQEMGLPYFDGNVSIYAGFPAAQVVLFSFIFVLIVGAIAYFLKRVNAVNKVLSFVVKKGLVFKLGYLAIILVFIYLSRVSVINYFSELQYLLMEGLDFF